MRKKIFMLSCLVVLLGISAGASAKDRTRMQSERAAAVSILVNNRQFSVDINQVQPTGMAAYATSPGYYSVRVNKGDVTLHLPYVGKGYNLPYGGGGERLQFTAPITSYDVKKGKKDSSRIFLRTRNQDSMTIEVEITVYPNGSAYVAVNPDGMQAISYRGSIDMNPQKSK